MPDPCRSSRDDAARSLAPPFVASPAARSGSAILALALALASPAASHAQTAAPPVKHNNNSYGSPLETLKSSRLWTDTPVAKDFVRASRPDAAALDYAPLNGVDPERAKPRDAANIAALQAEMERAGARGARLADGAPRPSRRSKRSAGASHAPAAEAAAADR